MPAILADAVFGFIESLLEAINWSKLGAPAAVAGTTVMCAIPLARWYANIQGRDLEGQLAVAKGEKAVVEQQLQAAQLQVAGQKAQLDAQSVAISDRDKTIAKRQAEISKLITGGKRLYKEVVDLRPLKLRVPELETQLADERKLVGLLKDQIAGKDDKLVELIAEVESRQKALDRTAARMRKVQRRQNYLTQAKAFQNVPKFRPLAERRRAIISVLNLKGGVGKTTITAHLAAALARKGYRVLMVDLDLQGSLSALMLPQNVITTRFKAGRLTQDFFRAAADNVLLKLSPYIVPVPGQPAGVSGSMSIVPTTDQLAYSELSLTLGWLLKQGERDARFLLRKALHFKTDNKPYDIVLLDCPPLLNISCVNALAASDFLLAPTLLTAKAAERIPVLMQVINQDNFKRHVNSQLKVLGVLASRANRMPPVGNEAGVWLDLPKFIDAAYVSQVKQFATVIGQDAKIAAGEEQFVHPEPGSRARAMFDELATEVERELPSDCCKAPPAAP